MTTGKPNKTRKHQVNPITLIWIAIFFFFIDYLAFQKPISSFITWLLIDYLAFPQLLSTLIAWLLVVIPLLLVAIAFFLWGLRKQFPWLSFPFDPLMMSTISPEWNNTFHAFLMCLLFLFLIIMATIVFFNK